MNGESCVPVSVAVNELDSVFGLGVVGVVNSIKQLVLADHSASRHHRTGEALSAGDHVRGDVELLRSKGSTETSKASDDFVKNQQNVVLGADLANLLEIALRRGQDTSRTSHRFDDDGRDGGSVVKSHEAFQIVGEVSTPLRLASGEGHVLERVGMREVVHIGQQSSGELLAGGIEATNADAYRTIK